MIYLLGYIGLLLHMHPYLHMAKLIGLGYAFVAAVSGLILCGQNGGC